MWVIYTAHTAKRFESEPIRNIAGIVGNEVIGIHVFTYDHFRLGFVRRASL